jgi:WhiB family transcriptional regulator, redox-sensing transcriptional regulator
MGRGSISGPRALHEASAATERWMGMEWVHRAKCKDEDPELFFPIGTTGPAAAQIDAAKAICMKCEVRVHCLEWALATGQDAGVWGGLSEEERRALRRVRRRESAGMRPVVVGT